MTSTVCCIKGCDKPVRTKAFCDKHYIAWNRYGHPLTEELGDYRRHIKPKTKERHALYAAIRRCYNPMNSGFYAYGGRGIQVCDRWRNNFETFYKDLGPAPIGSSLERIDVNGNYEPDNCRWATTIEQNRNQTTTVLNAEKVKQTHERLAKGEKLGDIARSYGVKYSTLWQAVNGTSWIDLLPQGEG